MMSNRETSAASPAVDAMTDAVRRLHPIADKVRRISGQTSPILSVEDFWESSFPLSCVALPNLCLQAICSYISQTSGAALPQFLQIMVDAAGTAAGRPVRGACIALCGKGVLIADENDTPEEQCFTLMHEGSHFLLDHYLPRADAIQRMGKGFAAVLDKRREPTLTERFDTVLRRTQVQWHTHLFARNESLREIAEVDADALACLLLMAPEDITQQSNDSIHRVPEPLASLYCAAIRAAHNPVETPRHPLLKRLGL